MTERWLDDYVPGTVHELGTVSATEAEIVEFAMRFDPQPMHVDPEFAARGPFGGIIASGWHTCSLMMRPYALHYLSPVSSLSAPGIDELRFLRPMRPDQPLRVRVTVEDARRSASKPDRGVVRSRVELLDRDGAQVMTMCVVNLIACRPASAQHAAVAGDPGESAGSA
jgi:acyl dehydratase